MSEEFDSEKYKIPGKNAMLLNPEMTLNDCKKKHQEEKEEMERISKIAKAMAITKNIAVTNGDFQISLDFVQHARYGTYDASDVIYVRGKFNWDEKSIYSTYRPDFLSNVSDRLAPKKSEGQSPETPFIMQIDDASVRFIVGWLNNSSRMNVDIKSKRSDNGIEVETTDDFIFKPNPHRKIITDSIGFYSWEDWCDNFAKIHSDILTEDLAKMSPTMGYFTYVSKIIKRVNFDLSYVEFCSQAQLLLSSYIIVLWNSFKIYDLYEVARAQDKDCVDIETFYEKYHSG